MFFETMEDVLPDLKVIIESPSGNMQTIYPLESFTGENAGNNDEPDRADAPVTPVSPSPENDTAEE